MSSNLFAYWFFHTITFERKFFSKIYLSKSKKSLRESCEYRCLLVSTDAEASTAGTDRYTHTHTHTHRHTHKTTTVTLAHATFTDRKEMRRNMRVVSAECCVTQQLAYFYPQPKPNHTRSRMLSTSLRRIVVHEVCSSSWERKPNLVGCGRATVVLRTAVRCAPQARAKAVSGLKKPAFGC